MTHECLCYFYFSITFTNLTSRFWDILQVDRYLYQTAIQKYFAKSQVSTILVQVIMEDYQISEIYHLGAMNVC